MKKLIGGLLVVAILTSPKFGGIEFVSYEMIKSLNRNPIFILFDKSELKDEDYAIVQIGETMADIDNNTRYMNGLFKERETILAKIQAKMDLYSYSRTSFEEHQIDNFVKFINYNNQSNQELKNIMKKLDSKKSLTDVTKEILHIDTDYELVYNELDAIRSCQCMAIENLNKFINESNVILDVL